MIKRKKSISLAILALSAISLSGCSSVTSGSEGVILTYTYNGKESQINTSDIIDKYLSQDRNNHAAAFFNALNEVVIRRAFEKGGRLSSFKTTVEKAATDDVEKQKIECDKNGQSWEDYLDENIPGDDLTTEEKEEEFFLQKEYEQMQDTVEDQYFETFNSYQKDSTDTTADSDQYNYNLLYGKNGYIQNKVPYHIRHILVQVDASEDYGYSRGHISSDDAHQIYQVVTALKNGNSFADTANLYTDDTTGNTGDNGNKLGGEYIMDNEESFVNEFKLGVYTYDLLLNDENIAKYDQDENYGVKRDNLHIPQSAETTLTNFGVTYIPYEVIDELERVKDVTTYNGVSINDGDEDYFPRNIYFNKYFQNRNVAFITNEALLTEQNLVGEENRTDYTNYDPTNNAMLTREDNVSGNTIYSDIDETGHYETSNVDYFTSVEDTRNFQTITINGEPKDVLCDTNDNPILVVRNQESSSGIHFIVIERSAFDTEGEENSPKASIEEYYAPVSPKSDDGIDPNTGRPYWLTDGTFPTYTANVNGTDVTLPKQTYVQTAEIGPISDVNDTVSNYTARVSKLSTDIRTAINTYDTFEWLNTDKITLENMGESTSVQSMVDRYVEKEKRASKDSTAQTLEDSWMAYASSILEQARQREYMLLPEILAQDFGNSALYKQGAPGYNPAYDGINSGTTSSTGNSSSN